MAKIEEELEAKLMCRIRIAEGASANPRWNLMNCMHYEDCKRRKERDEIRKINGEKGKRTYCLYNPGMFKCPEYQKFES